ncbi:hypothetical protein [Runella aurantiaca]|nr:hypothetical protein [Runella aurantiaca]
MIIDRLTFTKAEQQYTNLEDCLELDRRSYMSISTGDKLKRVVLPNAHLIVFETQFEDHEDEAEKDTVRKQLAPISLKAECRDIYDNKIIFERTLEWFSGQIQNE